MAQAVERGGAEAALKSHSPANKKPAPCGLFFAFGDREITDRMRIIRRLDFIKPDRVSATYDEHAQVLAAIQKRRADEAQRLMRAHIEHSKLEVRKITLDMLYQARNRGRAARKN